MPRVYLDHNATSPMRPEVRAVFESVLDELGGNPSSLHAPGRRARHRLDEARESVATALEVDEDEIVFTSGGTEANNLAVLGAVRAIGAMGTVGATGAGGKRAGVVTTVIEHAAVLEPARQLEREGYPLTLVNVDSEARVSVDDIIAACNAQRTALVSVVGANNEVGTTQPLADMGAALAALSDPPVFHTDLVQALGRAPFDLRGARLDLASFSAHKVGGPVGVGVLYRRRGVALQPLMFGGSQEAGVRPGTENVAALVAAARAIELAVEERDALASRLRHLQQALWDGIVQATTRPDNPLPRVRLLGPALDESNSARRLPGTLNLLLDDVDGKVLVTRLDIAGLEASAGSACASGSLEPSHVLRAMGLDENDARAGLRLSLGRTTTPEDVQWTVDIVRKTLGQTRAT